MDNVQTTARKLGLEVAPHGIRQAEDVAPIFDVLKGHADALYIVENALGLPCVDRQKKLALSAQLPTAFTTGKDPPEPGVSCLTDQTSQLCWGAPPTMSG